MLTLCILHACLPSVIWLAFCLDNPMTQDLNAEGKYNSEF
jgi:hypothetical protein